MANLRDIRRKILSIQKTEQITRAMKMVSAAKLRRTQDETLRIRPYYMGLQEVLERILENLETPVSHPLLTGREKKTGTIAVMLITSDRGLCGSFNHNLSREAERFVQEKRGNGLSVRVLCFGKKGRDYMKSIGEEVEEYWPNPGKYEFVPIQEIWNSSVELYKKGEIDEFYFVYPFFKSPIIQVPTAERFLPFKEEEEKAQGARVEHLFEPNREEALSALVEKLLETKIKAILLEAITSEHAARMTAMDNASNNASELIKDLTLKYNKARQESITKELLDIVNSAEAIKKGG